MYTYIFMRKGAGDEQQEEEEGVVVRRGGRISSDRDAERIIKMVRSCVPGSGGIPGVGGGGLAVWGGVGGVLSLWRLKCMKMLRGDF
jgi:hypothetical protein